MNAVERLWRGLAARDWRAVDSQFRPNAVVEWPHTGARMDAEEYVGWHRERAALGATAVVSRVVTEGRTVAVEARVGEAYCAGFYDLHDGLIVGAVEYWVGETV
jgi:ketosteroid isomerase-like protein